MKLLIMQDQPLEQVATTLAAASKSNASRARLVIVTQGADATLVASSSPSSSPANLGPKDSNPKAYPVPKLSSEKIVDTNGAGDMFAGGFLGALALGKSLDECIEIGHKLGQMCCGEVGPKLRFPKETVV
jgi:adenosine kinase